MLDSGNNNHLIRNNHKRTFSLPQKVQLASAIVRCACGDDFVVMVNALGELHFLIKSAVYIVRSFGGVKDVYCEENTIVVVLNDGTGAIGDFNVEKVMNSELTVSKIKVDEPIKKVAMGYGDIFMIGE